MRVYYGLSGRMDSGCVKINVTTRLRLEIHHLSARCSQFSHLFLRRKHYNRAHNREYFKEKNAQAEQIEKTIFKNRI